MGKVDTSLGMGHQCAPEDIVLASIPPAAGQCLLFFQPGLLHEGEDLLDGIKHILRTDVMYRRDPTTKPALNKEQQEGLDLVRQAEAATDAGDFDGACRLFRRAFKLYPELE